MFNEHTPVEVDPVAAQKLREAIADDPEAKGIRIGVLGGGCSGYTYQMDFLKDEPKDTDWVSEQWGIKVVVDEISATLLEGTVIEYEDKLMGGGFRFKNDKVRQCGCGESFQPTDKE